MDGNADNSTNSYRIYSRVSFAFSWWRNKRKINGKSFARRRRKHSLKRKTLCFRAFCVLTFSLNKNHMIQQKAGKNIRCCPCRFQELSLGRCTFDCSLLSCAVGKYSITMVTFLKKRFVVALCHLLVQLSC